MAAEQAIRARAHAFWESEGRPEGRALDHWLRAERELGGSDPLPLEQAGPLADHSVMGEEDPQAGLMAEPPGEGASGR